MTRDNAETVAVIQADREAAERAVRETEWAMDHCLPAKGESGKDCERRRLIDNIAAEIAEARLSTPAVEDEREACAKIADELGIQYECGQIVNAHQLAHKIAATIRARNSTTAPDRAVTKAIQSYSTADDEHVRDFIDGWNAALGEDAFDMALHWWMRGHAVPIATDKPDRAVEDGLREALEPFAKYADVYSEQPDGVVTLQIDFAHIRRARAALSPVDGIDRG